MRKFEFYPLTPDRWPDLEKLFGPRGASGGCWCMWWRLARAEYTKRKGAGNRRAFRKIVESDVEPGILAYHDGEPVGWCAIAPRGQYPVIERSRTLKPIDGEPVWSVSCFFIARPFRGQGMAEALLHAAVKFARQKGAKIVEGYPVEARKGRLPDAFAWTGLPPIFQAAGFQEVARRSPTRPIVRRRVSGKE